MHDYTLEIVQSKMEFDFGYFQEPQKDRSMEDIMKEVDRQSIDWDNFNQHQSKSFVSVEQEAEQKLKLTADVQYGDMRSSNEFQNSRDINEISYSGPNDQSFKFQQPPPSEPLVFDQRYSRVQQLMQKVRGNSLDVFYRNIEQSKATDNVEGFKTPAEFKEARNILKVEKRVNEERFAKENKGKPALDVPIVRSNFKKKQAFEQVLPKEFQFEDDGLGFGKQEEEVQREIVKYTQDQYFKNGAQFFEEKAEEQVETKSRQVNRLEVIRQERGFIEKPEETSKINRLLQDYREMKNNFNQLMGQVRLTSENKDKIANELAKLKKEYNTKQVAQEQDQRLEKSKKEERTQKLKQLKQEVEGIKDNTQDALFMKINEKIESLQKIVKEAMKEVNQDREQIVSKVVNYWDDREKLPQDIQLNFYPQLSQNLAVQNQEKQELFNIPYSNFIGQSRVREYRGTKSARDDRSVDLASPLNLNLSMEIPIEEPRELRLEFKPAEYSQEYEPVSLDGKSRNLKKCLTQKSSVLFESFQFYVTGKFSCAEDDNHPVWCQVRVANKCAIHLLDLFVVVYGPMASDLIVRPHKLMFDKVQSGTSFLFEVGINKQCLEDGGFSMQISYRLETVGKCKVNFKAYLPLLQLVKPTFIYEEQFVEAWNSLKNQIYIRPKTLNFKNIRHHDDLKLLMPFIDISENDSQCFALGVAFQYPKYESNFMMKVVCYVNGKASVHIRSTSNQLNDRKLREDFLDAMNYLCFFDN